ncbi:hypothetical protein BX667DRAFT_64936 [Coemansia mojavensis]|nr:hypothetical protein BX667DRAFT_64936 [Coemansia mojavensis]
MMRDHLQLYSTHDTYSDETIYSSASASDSTNSSARQSHKLRRQKSQLGNLKAPHNMSMHQQSQNPKQQQTQPYSAASQSGGGLRGVKQASGAGSSGKPGGVEHKPQQSQHSRSVSLLSRIRHTASPSASPTSSENSSRDTRSERTLAHSASAGSIRQITRSGDETAASNQQRRLSVKVLPPQDNVETQRPMRKRNSLRGDGKSGGFISQLLSRRASSRSRSPRSKSAQTVEAQPAHRFARSPGTPQSQRSAGSGGSGNSSRSPISIDDPDAASGEHFHVSQCPYVSRPLASAQSQPHGYSEQAGMYCVGSQDQGDIYYIHDNQAAMSEHVMHEHTADREHMRAAYGHGMNKHSAAPYGHGGWYDTNDSQMDSSRLVSALPVYEPIDMARMVEPQSSSSRYMRATQPTLPDAQMLAPMASLAGVCGAGDSGAALSNRELRFAVENHMLVEQHRYLIRDLGHARSAIGALKQVVQAKEERLEHCELANIELQQRIALLESVLTPEQRRHVLAYMPYTSSSSPSGQPLEVNAAEGGEYSRQTNIDEISTDIAASSDSQAHHMSGSHDLANSNIERGHSSEPLSLQMPNGSEADGKRVNRPLSGFATGYSFSDRPVHQLPRVFSGDYSSSDVQAMENSVETLASAIAAMPRDGDSVEDIIAAKPVEDNRDGTSTYGSAAERSITGGANSNGWQCDQDNMAEEMPPPAPPKRRSRFFAALRKSTAGLSTTGEIVPGSSTLKQKRRSVSLGNRAREQVAASVPETVDVSQHPETSRSRADTDESLVASCPTLLPNIAKSRPLQKQRLSSASSQGSNGRYPLSLGLGLESGENSRQPSQQSSISNTSEQAKATSKSRRKISQRLSFTPHPRRSTSAPSRPHSMRVTSRKSWLLQLFGVGSSSGSNDYFDVEDATTDESFVDDAPLDAAKSRRRRVMTQSSDEISRFLGRLRLEENMPHSMAGSSGMLEDLLDDSGEDDECGQSPLSVSQVRQQTLEALNGTLRGAKQIGAANQQQQQRVDDGHDDADTVDIAGSRWSTRRQKETLSPTIHRLADTHTTVPTPSASSMGLGIGASSRGSAQPQEQSADTARRARSNTGGADSLRAPRPADGDCLEHSSGSRWAPAFWVPPPQPPLSGSGVHNSSTWSPRNSIDSADTAESLGRHASDSSKRFCQSPQSSFNHAASGSSSSQGSHRGSSPWELVKMADAHTFPISPSHSRSGSPPSRALAFFEDTTVPDSDELTAAARRSLSLRMSRNSFKQVEPLPETDDSADFVKQQLPTVQDSSNPDMRKAALGLQNPTLARVAASGQTKRRSLLWQLNSKLASKPLQQAEASASSPKNEAAAAASGDVSPVVPAAHNVQAASDAARRSKKWWSSVLG